MILLLVLLVIVSEKLFSFLSEVAKKDSTMEFGIMQTVNRF